MCPNPNCGKCEHFIAHRWCRHSNCVNVLYRIVFTNDIKLPHDNKESSKCIILKKENNYGITQTKS